MEIPTVFQVVCAGRLFVKAALGRDIHFAADDGFNTVAGRGPVEIDRAKHIAMIGHGHRRHAVVSHPRHQVRNLIGSVQQAVLRVQMEMYKLLHCILPHSHSMVAGGLEEIS